MNLVTRRMVGLAAAVAVVGALAACGSDDTPTADEARASAEAAATSLQEGVEGAVSSVQSAAEEATDNLGGALDDAQLTVFVATFRTAYPQLSADRETASIETIVTETCPLIAANADAEEIDAKVEELATNGSSAPTADQVGQIVQMVRAACA